MCCTTMLLLKRLAGALGFQNGFLKKYFTREVVLNFGSVDEILKCNYSNESYWAILSCGAVYFTVQGGSTFLIWIKS